MDQRDENQPTEAHALRTWRLTSPEFAQLIRAGSREPAAFPEPAGVGLEVLT